MRTLGMGVTDTGRRANNEDALFVDDELGVYAVADGMGGRAAGEIASSMAIAIASDYLRATLPRLGDSGPVTPELAQLLRHHARAALLRACRAIFEAAQADPKLRGMGSTLTLLVRYGGRPGRRACEGDRGPSQSGHSRRAISLPSLRGSCRGERPELAEQRGCRCPCGGQSSVPPARQRAAAADG